MQEKAEIDEIQKKYIRRVYDSYDKDSNGILSYRELRDALKMLGLHIDTDEVKGILKRYKKEKKKNGCDEFEEIILEKLASLINPVERRHFDLFLAFGVFDRDGDGYINKKELSVCLTSMGQKMTPTDVDSLFTMLDEDGNGRLSVMEMSKMLAQ